MKLNIKRLDRLTVACARHKGPYENCEETWNKLLKWADEQDLEPEIFLGICHDDPTVVPADEIRYDACVGVPEGTAPATGIVIQEVGGADYGTFLHHGPYESLADAYEEVLENWVIGEGPCVEVYLNDTLRQRRANYSPRCTSRFTNQERGAFHKAPRPDAHKKEEGVWSMPANEVTIFINPSPIEAQSLVNKEGEARYIVDDMTKKVYLWSAEHGHDKAWPVIKRGYKEAGTGLYISGVAKLLEGNFHVDRVYQPEAYATPDFRHPDAQKFFETDWTWAYKSLIGLQENLDKFREIFSAKNDRLIQAARNGDLQTVTQMLETGIDPNWHRQSSAETALRAAAQAGHLGVVQLLLDRGAEVDFSIDNSSTALVEASRSKHWDVVTILLEHGADPFRRDDFEDQTPVWMAASEGQESIITLMLENASDDASRDQVIQEVLLGASFAGNLSLMRFALEQGAGINGRGAHDETALMEAARAGNPDVIRFLLAEGSDVHLQDESGNTALSCAVHTESTVAVQLLIEAGSDIRHRNRACRESGTRLDEDGTKVRYERRFGYSVLECACMSGYPEVVKLLLGMGLDPNEIGWEGRTPLMLTHCPEIAELLLQGGAEVDARDPHGSTALMSSAWSGDVEVVRVLLDHGADVNAEDCSSMNWTPLIWACESDVISLDEASRRPNHDQPLTDHVKLLAVVKLLVERGADINRADARGCTALWYAFRYNCLNVVEYLIESGARTNLSEDFEERLRQAAIDHKRPLIMELLKQAQT